jgi:hypothetical protein
MGLRPRSVPLGLPSRWGGSPLTPFAARSVDSAIVLPGFDGHNARLATNSRGVQLFCFTTASKWRRNTAQEADQSHFCVYASATQVPVLPPHLCSALASTSVICLEFSPRGFYLCPRCLLSRPVFLGFWGWALPEGQSSCPLSLAADLGPRIERRRS